MRIFFVPKVVRKVLNIAFENFCLENRKELEIGNVMYLKTVIFGRLALGPSINDIRFLGGGVCLPKSKIIGYRGVRGSSQIGYPIFYL